MSADDEIAQSLDGTMGYRMGQINPDTLVSAMTNLIKELITQVKLVLNPRLILV